MPPLVLQAGRLFGYDRTDGLRWVSQVVLITHVPLTKKRVYCAFEAVYYSIRDLLESSHFHGVQ